jgi:hypothetical protein
MALSSKFVLATWFGFRPAKSMAWRHSNYGHDPYRHSEQLDGKITAKQANYVK